MQNKIVKSFLILTSLLQMVPIKPVIAESYTTTSEEKGNIIIDYFDDSNHTVPVPDSTWTLFKIGEITTTSEDGYGVDSLEITSYLPELEITREVSAEQVFELMEYEYVTSSEISMSGKSKSGIQLEYWKATTNKNGRAEFNNLKEGVYLGVETEASDFHIVSTPFLVSIPWTTDDGTLSHLDKVIEPKASIAGDLTVIKKTLGDGVSPEEVFTMTITLPEGRYHYTTTRGQEGTIDTQGVVAIQAYEEIRIEDIPQGGKFLVEEAEANQNGYRTWYSFTKDADRIEGKEAIEFVVFNERYIRRFIKTGVGTNLLIGTGTAAIAIGALVIINKKRNKKSN